MDNNNRNLSDEDIRVLVTEMKKQFYANLGKGVWGIAWKVIIVVIVGIAYLGMNNKIP